MQLSVAKGATDRVVDGSPDHKARQLAQRKQSNLSEEKLGGAVGEGRKIDEYGRWMRDTRRKKCG